MADRLTQLHKLLEADAADSDLPYMIALEHTKADQLDDALTWLDKTLALDAGHLYAYYQKGRVLSELGRDDDAKRLLTSGIEKAKQAGDEKAANELMELLGAL